MPTDTFAASGDWTCPDGVTAVDASGQTVLANFCGNASNSLGAGGTGGSIGIGRLK